jgi:hypothetical protein
MKQTKLLFASSKNTKDGKEIKATVSLQEQPTWIWSIELNRKERSKHAHNLLLRYYPVNKHLRERHS